MPATDAAPFKNKTRVRVTAALPGVPEGTVGTVKDTVGFALPRHRVAFDNGRFVTSVARSKLVRDDEWDEFLREREEAEARAAEAAATPAESAPAEAASETPAAAPQDDRLAALLAKSKAAREKKAAEG